MGGGGDRGDTVVVCRPPPFLRRPRSELELVGHLGGDVLEGHGGPGDAFEADAVEGKTGKFANFHFPLDEGIVPRSSVGAEEDEPFLGFAPTTVGVQNFPDFP